MIVASRDLVQCGVRVIKVNGRGHRIRLQIHEHLMACLMVRHIDDAPYCLTFRITEPLPRVRYLVSRCAVQPALGGATIVQASNDLLAGVAPFGKAYRAIEVEIQVLRQECANRLCFDSSSCSLKFKIGQIRLCRVWLCMGGRSPTLGKSLLAGYDHSAKRVCFIF